MSRNQEVYRRQVDTVNEQGEKIAESVISVPILVKDEEHFTFIFRRLIQTALNLEGTAMKVLFFCCDKAELNTNEVALTKAIKLQCQHYTAVYEGEGENRKLVKKGLSIGSINNAITTLVKRGFLIPVGTSGQATYKIDSRISWRGSMKQRNADLSVNFKFQLESKKSPMQLPHNTDFEDK